MALVIETGVGVAGADSYVSEATATAYLGAHYTTAQLVAWTAASAGDKEIAIRNAAQFLVAEYGLRWKGARAHDTQGMDWPRYDVEDEDGYLILSTVVPQRVLDAQSELAKRAIAGALVSDVLSGASGIASESKSIAGISKSVSYLAGGKSSQTEYALIDALLKGLLQSGARVVRG